LKIELVKIEAIKPYPGNAKAHPRDQVKKIAQSIQEYGFQVPILLDKENVIITGHGRLLAAKKLKMESVPTVRMDHLTDAQVRAFRLMDNRSNESDWLPEDLANELKLLSLEGFDLELTGFDGVEIEKLFDIKEGLTDPDEVPEVPKVAITKPGDIWLLGKHRVMCGDSTKAEDVERLMDGVKAAVLFVDPPYGMKYNPNMSDTLRHKKGNWQAKINNYSPVIADDKDFDPSFLQELFKYCKEQFWWGADYYAERLIDKNKGSWIVWDKRKGIEDMEWSTSEFELCWSKARHHRQIARITWSGILGTEQEFDHSDGRKHPTQKPILLVRWFIEKFSKEDDVIADLFGGSGSTLIAAEQTGRTAYLMEIDCLYCDVIINRYLQFVGIDGKVFLSTNDKEAIPYEEVCKMRKGKATL